jgi:hypothetical protein
VPVGEKAAPCRPLLFAGLLPFLRGLGFGDGISITETADVQIRHHPLLISDRDRLGRVAVAGFDIAVLLITTWLNGSVDENLQAGLRRRFPSDYVGLGEDGHQDLPRRAWVASVVIDHVDRPVGRLRPVEIRKMIALIEHHPVAPRGCIVCRDVSGQEFAMRPLVDRPVLDQEQVARLKLANEEPGPRVFDGFDRSVLIFNG